MTASDLERARFNMIEQQIRPWDVLDLQILDLLSQVRREEFVPLAHKALAFVDMQIPLQGDTDAAMRRGECMLEPKVEARMLQDLRLAGHEKVLEVGAGSGYMAALLSRRAQRVISLEIKPELARMARENLQRAGITNVDVRETDGAGGLPGEGPFDAIVLSG
jgi:protein-L-isoaspartate(D-aspartate) O-methyltransferase